MHEELKQIDQQAAERIHPHDSQRIQRALEVYRVSGKTLTEWQSQTEQPLLDYPVNYLAIAPEDRAVLHERIALRFNLMLKQGLIAEVQKLKNRGDLHLGLPSMRSVGYRQVWEYLEGKLSEREMVERAVIATRQLAKRQLTWLRSWPDLKWFDSESPTLEQQVINYLRQLFDDRF